MEKEAKALKTKQCFINSVLCVAGSHLYAVAAYGKPFFQQFLPHQHRLLTLDRQSGQPLSSLPIQHESCCTPSMLNKDTLIVPSKPFLQGLFFILRQKSWLFRLLLPKPNAFFGVTLYTRK